MILEDIMHSGIPNYRKPALNSFKMIQNDTVSQPIKRGLISPCIDAYLLGGLYNAVNVLVTDRHRHVPRSHLGTKESQAK